LRLWLVIRILAHLWLNGFTMTATVSTMLKPFLQQYLHDRSAPLVASQLSADEQRMLGQAVMLEEDDWMEWKAARAMLESWLGLDKAVNE
jgi:hypothetical protein